MPRADKPISSGRLNDPVSPSRGHGWAKYSDPGASNEFVPDPGILLDPLTQESVDLVVDLAEPEAPKVAVATPEAPPAIQVYEWTTVRSIEGRTYMRMDERHRVEAED